MFYPILPPLFIAPQPRKGALEVPTLTAPSEKPTYAHLPDVHPDMFAEHPRAAYLVAVAAVGNDVFMPDAFRAARELRYNKYASLDWIDRDNFETSPDGRKIEPLDRHDASSDHLVVIKNMNMHGAKQPNKVIATARSIVKQATDGPLPVEHAFPEVFDESPAPVGANEVSRLISDSLNKSERALASMALQRGITHLCTQRDQGPTYAMVEGYLVKRLKSTHFPHEMMTDFKAIPEYNDTRNALMMTDWRKVVAGTTLFKIGVPITTSLFFRGVSKPDTGFGFYGKRFLRSYGHVKPMLKNNDL